MTGPVCIFKQTPCKGRWHNVGIEEVKSSPEYQCSVCVAPFLASLYNTLPCSKQVVADLLGVKESHQEHIEWVRGNCSGLEINIGGCSSSSTPKAAVAATATMASTATLVAFPHCIEAALSIKGIREPKTPPEFKVVFADNSRVAGFFFHLILK